MALHTSHSGADSPLAHLRRSWRMTSSGLAVAFLLSSIVAIGTQVGSIGTAGASSASSKSVTVGILTSRTGAFAVEDVNSYTGELAVIKWANSTKKYPHINTVTIDLQSSPANALTDAKELVQQDHVTAILALDPFVALAGTYLASTGIPVISQGLGPVTNTQARNIFGAEGNAAGTSANLSTYPLVAKTLGGTTVGSFGLSVAQGAVQAATIFNQGATQIGMKAPYLNVSVPIGQPDFAPQALALKQAGVNTVWAVLDEATQTNLMQSLVQNKIPLKVIMSPQVYDPSSITPTNVQYYQNVVGPTNSSIPGTQKTNPRVVQATAILRKYGNYKLQVANDAAAGYTAGMLLVYGFQLSASNPTPTNYVNKLRSVTHWLGGLNIGAMNFKNPGPYTNYNNGGQGLCTYGMRLRGNLFYDATGLVCGKILSSS